LKEPSLKFSVNCGSRWGSLKTCACNGTAYYGIDDDWTSKEGVEGSIPCDPEEFPPLNNPKGAKLC